MDLSVEFSYYPFVVLWKFSSVEVESWHNLQSFLSSVHSLFMQQQRLTFETVFELDRVASLYQFGLSCITSWSLNETSQEGAALLLKGWSHHQNNELQYLNYIPPYSAYLIVITSYVTSIKCKGM